MARRRKRSLPQRLTNQYTPQAQVEARLKYAPQRRALGEALGEAQGQRDQAISSAHGVSRGLRQTIDATRPEVKDLYRVTGNRLKRNAGVVAGLMPSSPAASAIAAAASTEHQGALDRNASARVRTLNDLSDQKVRAREGEGYAVRQAGVQYRQDAGKILDQLLGVSQDQGDYTAAELGRLVDAALGRHVTLHGQKLQHQDRVAGQTETHRHNVQSERNQAAHDRAVAQGKKYGSLDDQNTAQDTIHQALDYARDFVKTGTPREKSAHALLRGVDDQTLKAQPIMEKGSTGAWHQRVDPKTGMKLYRTQDGKVTTEPEVTIPGVPPIKQDIYVRAALDVAYQGYLGRGTQAALKKRGIRINSLGVPTYNSARAKRIRQQRTPHPHGGRPSQGAAGYPYGPGAGQVH